MRRFASMRAAILLAFPLALAAQGTAADYARAEALRDRYKGAIVGTVEQTAWIDSTSRFWYRRSTREGSEFLVDAETKNEALGVRPCASRRGARHRDPQARRCRGS